MATKYQDVTYGSFGGGIDALSPESKIPDDYVQSLDNMDPTPNGSLIKRTGTQLYGTVPVRVERLEYERVGISPNYSGELCLYLDTSIDVLSLRSTPIFLYGRTSQGQAGGDLTSIPSGHYYPSFTTDIRQSIAGAVEAPAGVFTDSTTTVLLDGNTHDQGPLLAVSLYRSLNNNNLTNQSILGSSYSINKLTGNVSIPVTTGIFNPQSPVAFESFVVAKSRANDPGTSYNHTAAVAASTSFPNPVQVVITSATHNLSSFNILVDCYLDDGTSYERIVPDSYTVTAEGSVILEFVHYQDFNLVACLYTVPASQSNAQLIEAGEINETIILDYPETPFLLYQMFKENLDGSRSAIFGSANLSTVDAVNASSTLDVALLPGATSDYRATFYITNQQTDPSASFTCFTIWDYGRLVSNKLCVDASDPIVDDFQITIPGIEHRLGEVVSTTVVQATNPTNENNLLIQYDGSETSTLTDDISISLINNTGSQFTAYAMLADRSTASGAYHGTHVLSLAGSTSTFTITAATHGKGTNINVCLFKVIPGVGTTTSYQEEPITSLVNATGDVSFTVVNATADNYYLLPVIYPVTSSAVSSSIPDGTTGLFALTGLTSSFAFIHVYAQSGTNLIRITPDRISINSILGTAGITFTNNSGSAVTLEAYWDYSDYTATAVVPTTASGVNGYSDDNPQLTIWGLPHRQLYSGATGQTPGYVTHVDTYRAQAEERAVCGLGGNLFASYSYEEALPEYGMGLYYPNLRARVASTTIVGPAFIGVNDPDTRTQGAIKFINASNNQAAVLSSSYLGTSQVSYRLYVPSLTVVGNLSTIFNTGEFLTVEGMGYAINNGDFQVVSASLVPSTDYLDVVVTNPALDTIDWNETASDGRAGIFTDRVPLEVTCPFFEGDRLLSASWGEEQFLIATGTSAGNEVRFEGLHTNVTVPDGLLLVGARTSRIVPLRSINAVPTTTNLVAGDILGFTGLERQLRARFVNPRADETVTIANNTTVTTIEKPIRIQVASSNLFQVGQRVLLINAGPFTGERIVKEIISPTLIQVEGDQLTSTISGAIIVGQNVEVDEEFDWYDSITSTVNFEVARRWLPVEEPTTDYLQLPPNRYRYLSAAAYDNQPFLRSTMVQDTMYLTNGLDAVQRYDGQTLTRAGLFRWQPSLYLTVDTSAAKIVPNTFQIDNAKIKGVGTDSFEVDKYLDKHFQVGEIIRYTNVTSGVTTVRDLIITNAWEGNTESFIQVNTAGQALLTGGTKTLNKISVFSYYYRLNLLDVNNNVVVSAITGAQDARVEVAQDCTIRHLVARPPFLDNFDFARVEIQVYRTKANSVGPYYLVTTLQPSWNQGGEAYIEYSDTENDNSLLPTGLDAVTTVLTGQELGQTWTGPLRSKYITSNSNSLVLANFRSWPTLTITPQRSPLVANITSASYANKTVLLRKANTDTGVTTDNLTRMKFEFVTNGSRVISLSGAAIDYDSNELTITQASHGLTAGDWVYLFYSDSTPANVANVNPRVAGHYQVSSAAATNQFKIQISNSLIESIQAVALNSTDVNRYVTATSPRDIPVWMGFDRGYGTVAGLRQNVLDPITFAFLRLANAINSAQAACSTLGFVPWVVANAGGEYRDNQIVLETPYVTEERLEAVLPTFTDLFLFANGVRVDAGASVQASVQLFPSRVLLSYPNYPELFDAPTTFLDTDSDSAIDVNPSDGQEITGIIPFFAESAFGAAQKDAILLVFKTASVYLLNIAAKRAGQPCVQRLDTRGIGCTAPYSIAPTQNGIMFANQSGIYRITTGLQCQYIGRRVERIWREDVDLAQLDLQLHGHYYPLGNQYKLSVPYRVDEKDYSQRALVYNTVREYTADGYRDGSWTSYSNMPAIGWANMLRQSLFATPFGEVFTLRMTGDSTDYRDDGAPIEAMATLRALDFGSSSIRKMISNFNLQFRPEDADTDVVVESAIDLIDNWEVLDAAVISRQRTASNINSRNIQQLSIIQYMSNRRKGVYYQLRVSNGILDQGLQLTGASVMVSGLGPEGTIQAKETASGRR